MRIKIRQDQLAEHLARRQISLQHWSKKMGLSCGHLSDLVNGKRRYPRPATRRKLMRALEAEFDELFELEAPHVHRASHRAAVWTEKQPRISGQDRPRQRVTRFSRWFPLAGHRPGTSTRGETTMVLLRQDLRFAIRQLLKQPGFTVAALLILTLGIASNTALFSLAHTLLWKPFPYGDPEQLIYMFTTEEKRDLVYGNVSYPDFVDFRQQTASVLQLAVYDWEPYALAGGESPIRLGGARVSHDLFEILRVQPILGRTFTAEEDQPGSDAVVILSEALWRGQFGADSGLLGQSILLNGQPRTVIGVMPGPIDFPEDAHFWVPIARDASKDHRGSHWLQVVGRVHDGVDPARAAGVLQAVAERLAVDYPADNEGRGARLEPMRERHLRGGVREMSLLLLGVVTFVLLIVCANVAHLLLARGASRTRELAIRTALGAGRLQLVRQLMIESLLLALMGCGLGLALGMLAIRRVSDMIPVVVPAWVEFSINGAVVAYTAAVSLVAALLCGLAPAMQSWRADLRRALQGGVGLNSAGTRRLRGAFVVGEVALSLVLLAGAGFMLQSMLHLTRSDSGVKTEGVLTVGLDMLSLTGAPAEERVARIDQYLERFAALPGVEHAAVVDRLPMKTSSNHRNFFIEGRADQDIRDNVGLSETVSADYFEVMGIPLYQGEIFSPRQQPGVYSIVISRSLAERYWPEQNPIGQRLSFGRDTPWYEIRGVVGDVRHYGLEEAAPATLYLPYWQSRRLRTTWVLATSGDPLALVEPVRAAVAEIDPHQPLHDITPMQGIVDRSLWQWRFFSQMFWTFAAMALVLAAVGIYGVMSYTVSQRTREVGIRMALGAGYTGVLRMVMRQGLGLVLIGLLIGVPMALGLGKVLAGVLHGVSAFEPVILTGIVVLLAVVAWTAILVPAHRAASTDPLRAIRYE